MFGQITNIFRKEWLEILRDYRTLITLVVMAVAVPFYIYFLLNMIGERRESDPEIKVSLVGETQAPNMIQFLTEQGVVFTNYETLEEAKEQGKSSSVIFQLEDQFRENYEASLPATVNLFINQKNDRASGNARQIRLLLGAYERQIQAARMVARGVSPARTDAIRIESFDLTTSGEASNFIAGLVLYFFLLTAFTGTMAAGADLIAGEKERQTLQPLLAQPVTRTSLVLGKWLTLASLGSAFTAVAFLLAGFVIARAPLAAAGVTFYLDLNTLLSGALSLAVLALFATSLQIFIAARAKTYREAMTYLPWTALVPLAITFVPLFTEVEYGGAISYVPIFNQAYVLRELLLEGTVPLIQYAGGLIATLVLAALLLWMTIGSFGTEKALD